MPYNGTSGVKALSIVMLAGHICLGQSPPAANLHPLVTDRPDFTESSDVVRAGWFQTEAGFALERYSSVHEDALSFGSALFRIGLGHRLELRIGNVGMESVHPAGGPDRTSGPPDTELGFKYKIVDETRYWPAFGFIGLVSAPTGAPEFTSNTWDPVAKFTWAKSFPAGFDVSGNFNWAYLGAIGGRLHQKTMSVSTGHGLPAGFSGFWEVYGFTGAERGEPSTYVFDTGLTRGIGRNAQWDVSFGHRLGHYGSDWVFGFGISARFPLSVFSRGKRG